MNSQIKRLPRIKIIDIIGRQYHTDNIENGEYSYQKDFDRHLTGHFKLDIRFFDKKNKIAILVETKDKKFKKADINQLFDYVKLEKELSNHTKIIAILAGTHDGSLRVWKIANGYDEELSDTKLKSLEEYISYFQKHNVNDKTKVLENTATLNRMLHDNGIQEGLRSQFVGTCLLALKEGLVYKNLTTSQILAGIKGTLGTLLQDSVDKANKISVLDTEVLQDQNVQKIDADNFIKLLAFIEDQILPYINEASTEGHDILSYFFTTFNKYVQKGDKNQAFTPNHIAHFMCKVSHITRKTRVLDPTCGSGTFLVQAMSQALSKCETNSERDHVKQHQIFGIESDKKVYGLSTTNMLIHGDGNSNIYCGSCFEKETFIRNADVDLVLMNPPYNASKKQVDKDYAKTWGKSTTDPSKGLYFVEYVANAVNKGRLITLLPMQAAIGESGIIAQIKKSILEHHTLDAVFSFPSEMFYPGASAVACCMVFDLGKPHADTDKDTFFGFYKDDGFEKRKGVGRVDSRDKWETIEALWIELYEHRTNKPGISVTHKVGYNDEWCAEAYMETDYKPLSDKLFIDSMRDYSSFLMKHDDYSIPRVYDNKPHTKKSIKLSVDEWKWIPIDKLFKINPGHYYYPEEYETGNTPYCSASANNNAVAQYIDLQPDFEGNQIMTGKVGCTAFYQPSPFSATSDVNVFITKKDTRMNPYIGMFLITIINFSENYKWDYGRQCRKNDTEKIKIKLPVIAGTETPDWQFMEDYIKSLPYSKNI